MRLDIHIHNDSQIEVRLRSIEYKLDLILKTQEKIMSELSDQLDALEANTTAIDGVGASAESAFAELAVLIESLRTATTDPATAARIKAVAEGLRARAASLAVAVEARPRS